MQAIYASEVNEALDRGGRYKYLEKILFEPYEIYLFNLLLLMEIADYSRRDAEIKASKFLPTEKDKYASTRLAENSIIGQLRENKRLANDLKQYKLRLRIDMEVVKHIFHTLYDSEKYIRYLEIEPVPREDKKILTFLLQEIMLEEEIYQHQMEELFATWHDDEEAVVLTVSATLKAALADGLDEKVSEQYDKIGESLDFARSLMEKTLDKNDPYTEMIAPKLENWEVDRIARVDMILMKMALCEILEFPNIPVKVTINEYVDISKYYSTPKSREFINGILDKLMKELRDQGKIFKSGRGLLNQ